jgi:preprotein translocase subunit YajC
LTALELKDMTDPALNMVLAQAASGAPPAQAPPSWISLPPLILIMVVFYFILIRPQQRKAKEHEALLKTLRPKDKVVTSGGVMGVIVSVQDKTVTIRSAETKLEVLKSAVSEITERAAGEA